jgi:valyl-tRNA synthetase
MTSNHHSHLSINTILSYLLPYRYVFDRCMRLLHPFMPFLTETLWQLTPHHGDSLMAAAWPVEGDAALHVDDEAVAAFGSIQALVRAIRNARAEYVFSYTTIVLPPSFSCL